MRLMGPPIDTGQLRQASLFANQERSGLESIASSAWMVRDKRGAHILSRGDRLDGLFVVLDGSLTVNLLSCSGTERILRVLESGDSLGEATFLDAAPSQVYIESLSAVELAYFPRDAILASLSHTQEFLAGLVRSLGAVTRSLIHDLETCCLQSALQRTVCYLLRRAAESPGSPAKVELPAAKATIASTLNLSAETYSREWHRLQDDGLISIHRRTIHMCDPDTLAELAVSRDALVQQTMHQPAG